jgi:hypothetical protein
MINTLKLEFLSGRNLGLFAELDNELEDDIDRALFAEAPPMLLLNVVTPNGPFGLFALIYTYITE